MSIGVGQIRSYIAAMNLCETQWREKPPKDDKGANAPQRNAIEEQIRSDYNNLSFRQRNRSATVFSCRPAVALVTKS